LPANCREAFPLAGSGANISNQPRVRQTAGAVTSLAGHNVSELANDAKYLVNPMAAAIATLLGMPIP